MICIDAEQLQDGLYNIKEGKIYKYKAKGGTARVYKLENRPQGEVDAVEIYEQAERRLERSEISIGKFESIIDPLRHLYYDRPQEWIPCSERLPIEYRTVLVTWEYKGKPYTTTAFRETKNAVTYWASNEQPNYTPLNVVAWRPLPKPWKGADDE